MTGLARRFRSLHTGQRVVVVATPLVAGVFLLNAIFDLPNPTWATLGGVLCALGFPFVVWGSVRYSSMNSNPLRRPFGLQRAAARRQKELHRQLVGREAVRTEDRADLVEYARHVVATSPAVVRHWPMYAALTTFLLGLILFMSDVPDRLRWLAVVSQVCGAVTLVIMWVELPFLVRRRRRAEAVLRDAR